MSDSYIEVVNKTAQQDALKHLHLRTLSGEKVEDILKIYDEYYTDKIVKGLIPMSTTIYDRIMRK